MATIDCPWCTGPLALDATFSTVTCDDCSVTVTVAADPAAGPQNVETLDLAA